MRRGLHRNATRAIATIAVIAVVLTGSPALAKCAAICAPMVPAPSTAADWIVCLILVAAAGRNHLDGGWPAEKAVITLAVPCHRRNFVAVLIGPVAICAVLIT